MTDPIATRPLRVLLASDDSPSARAAEMWALALPAPAGRRLDIVTVASPRSAWSLGAQTYREPVAEAVDGLREGRQRDAEAVANTIGERLQAHPDVTVRTWARMGRTPDEVLALVAETAPDLVALGHRSRAAVLEHVLGSVAREVLARSTRPVLVARRPPGGRPAPRTAVILAETPAVGEQLVDKTTRLGILRGAVAHVVCPVPELAAADPERRTIDRRLAADAGQLLGLTRTLEARGVTVTASLEPGPPEVVVERAAAELDAELLLVARTPRTERWLDRLTHGTGAAVLAVPVP